MKIWVIALLVAGRVVAAESQDFARYQIIVDRAPFGAVTAAGVPDAVPNFAQRFQLVGIVTSTGLPVAAEAVLSDKEANNRALFKAEGEMIEGGVKVVRIQDALTSKAKVVLQFGLETATLTFAERQNTPTAGTPQPGQPPQPPGGVPGRPPIVGRIPFRRGN